MRLNVASPPIPLTQLFEFAFKVPIVHDDVLNSCNRGALSILGPMALNLIVGKGLVATKEYQTSGELALPQNALILAVAVAAPLAFRSVPAVGVQVVPGVNGVALEHALLPGWAMADITHSCIMRNKIP